MTSLGFFVGKHVAEAARQALQHHELKPQVRDGALVHALQKAAVGPLVHWLVQHGHLGHALNSSARASSVDLPTPHPASQHNHCHSHKTRRLYTHGQYFAKQLCPRSVRPPELLVFR